MSISFVINFIAHYLPKAEILQRIIRKYWHLIKNDPKIGTKFKKNLTIGFKRKSSYLQFFCK
jgi:hypothetical protein